MFRELYTVGPTFAASIRLPALGHFDQPIQKLELATLIIMEWRQRRPRISSR